MSPWPTRALLLLVAGTLAVGCGGKDTDPSRFLSSQDANYLRVRVEQADSANGRDDCSEARSEIARALTRVDTIDGRDRVSKRLTRNLRDWLENLRGGISDECGRDTEPSATPTPEETIPEETTPTETETEPEETTPTEPEETPTPSPTPEETPTPIPTPSPDNGGAPSDPGDELPIP